MDTRYDILIVGAGISGLISAVLLASKGYRVAVVSGGEKAGFYEKGEYGFNERPVLTTGLDGGPLGRIFDEIGIQKEIGTRGNVPLQVVLPDERIDIYEEPGLFHEELRRTFPKEMEKISAFYARVSGFSDEVRRVMDLDPFSFKIMLPSGIRKGRRFAMDLAEGLGLSSRFHSFIRAQLSAFSYLSGPVSFMTASSLLESCRKGLYYTDGGKYRLKEILLKKVKELNGDFIGSPAKEISRHGNRWLLRTEGEALSGRVVIGNMDVLPFCGLFLDGNGSYLKKAERVKKSIGFLTINLGVKEAGVPAGMTENVIMLRDYRKEPVPGDFLFIQRTHSAEGKTSLSFTCHVPEEEWGEGRIREISEKVLEGVDWLCPFIERHVEVMDMRYPEPDGEGVFVSSLRQRMGVGTLPYKISEGVFFAGPEVFPALGFDGLVYSGEMAASAALKGLERGKA